MCCRRDSSATAVARVAPAVGEARDAPREQEAPAAAAAVGRRPTGEETQALLARQAPLVLLAALASPVALALPVARLALVAPRVRAAQQARAVPAAFPIPPRTSPRAHVRLPPPPTGSPHWRTAAPRVRSPPARAPGGRLRRRADAIAPQRDECRPSLPRQRLPCSPERPPRRARADGQPACAPAPRSARRHLLMASRQDAAPRFARRRGRSLRWQEARFARKRPDRLSRAPAA